MNGSSNGVGLYPSIDNVDQSLQFDNYNGSHSPSTPLNGFGLPQINNTQAQQQFGMQNQIVGGMPNGHKSQNQNWANQMPFMGNPLLSGGFPQSVAPLPQQFNTSLSNQWAPPPYQQNNQMSFMQQHAHQMLPPNPQHQHEQKHQRHSSHQVQNSPAQFFQQLQPHPQQMLFPQQGLPQNIPNSLVSQMTALPTQVLHDALRMSQPVLLSRENDEIVVRTLLESRKYGHTYKQALESLHNRNGHAAPLWKDYYLDNAVRLNEMIEKYAPSLQQSATAPQKSSKLVPPPPSVNNNKSAAPRSTSTYVPPPPRKGEASKRRTMNSITAPSAVYSDRLPPPNSEIQIPEPPSRSPTPPTRVQVKGGRNIYTQEDRDYFIKFISWRLKHDTDLTRAQLCEMLSEKVPSHSAGSWASHWSSRHDIADKILNAAQGIGSEESLESSDEDAEGSDEDESGQFGSRSQARGRGRPRKTLRSDQLSSRVKTEYQPVEIPSAKQSRRNTLRSKATGLSRLPVPPSRSPSPPHKVEKSGTRGNRFTEEDKEYMIKFIGWKLKQDPSLTRGQLCEMLAKKAPHHGVGSWQSYWQNNATVPNNILSAAHGEEPDSEEGSDSQSDSSEESDDSDDSSVVFTSRSRPRAAPVPVKASTSRRTSIKKEAESSDVESYNSDDVDLGRLSDDERNMGEAGGPYTDADLRVIGRHLATLPDDASYFDKWGKFSEKHPQRSDKAWSEYYRRQKKHIEKYKKKYRKHHEQSSVVSATNTIQNPRSVSTIAQQRARPSWATSSNTAPVILSSKRKFTPDKDGGNDQEARSKLGRLESRPELNNTAIPVSGSD